MNLGLSNCCGAPLRVAGNKNNIHGGTCWYECSLCGYPCDPKIADCPRDNIFNLTYQEDKNFVLT